MPDNLADYAAATLQAELTRRELSSAEFARQLGVDEKWVGRRKRGRTAITMADLERIAKALELPAAHFIPTSERAA